MLDLRLMMLKNILFFAVVFISGTLFAQRDTREIIDAENIKSIQIDTDEVYHIKITATKTSQISISTHSEGEYFNDIILNTEQQKDVFKISTRYPERLTGGYDKLSAHKVFSLEIELEVPQGLEVIINSNIASVEASGEFRSIYADLKQGYCKLLDFSGDAVINTYSGHILVETSSGLIEAESRNGTVEIPDFLPGRNPLRLKSIDGDIKVRKN